MAQPRYITEAEVEGQVIPDGGTEDQVLAKNSETDFDLKWANVVGAGGILGSIADQQVAFGDGTDIAGDDNLKYDVALHALTVGTVTLNTNDDGTASFLGGDLVIDGGGGGDAHLWNPGNRVILGDQLLDFSQASVTIDGSGITLFAAVPGAQITLQGICQLTPSAAPESPFEGMIYADSDDHHLYFYNGTAWKQLDN